MVKPRLVAAFAAASPGAKAAVVGGVLAALLLFAIGLSWMLSPTMTATGGQVFAEKPPAAAAAEKPWLERMMTLSPFGGSSASDAPAAASAGTASGWHFRRAAPADARASAPSAERASAAAPRLQSGSLPGLGGLSGGSSGASASYAAKSDGVFHGDGGTGLVVKDLKHAAAQAGWRPGPKATAEDVKGFGARQADVLETTRGDRFALASGAATGGGGTALGGPGGPGAHSAAAPNDAKNDSFKDPSNKPHDSQQKPSMSPPGGGGCSPGKNCQALQAPTAAPPTNGATADPARTQSAQSFCQSNTDLARHEQLADGESNDADAKQCAAVCNQAAAATAGGAPGAGSPAGNSTDGYKTLQKKANQEMKKLADKAKNDCLEPNKQAAQLVQSIQPAAVVDQLSEAATMGDGEGPALQQSPLQQQASTAAQGWQRQVRQAQQTHDRAAQACRQLAQPSTFQPVEDKMKATADKLREDYQRLGSARDHASVPDSDLTVGPATRANLARFQQEYQTARQSYDRSKQALDDFKSAVQGGSIKSYDQSVGQYVSQADRAVGQANSSIGTASPGSSVSFSQAQSGVQSAMSPLSAGADTGSYQAGMGVLQRVQALPSQ